MTNIILSYIGGQVSMYILGQAKRFLVQYIENNETDAVQEMKNEWNFQEFFMENDNENFEKEIELETRIKKTKNMEESWEFIG